MLKNPVWLVRFGIETEAVINIKKGNAYGESMPKSCENCFTANKLYEM